MESASLLGRDNSDQVDPVDHPPIMQSIPPEIVRCILRETTYAQGALETSLNSTLLTQREEVLSSTKSSMADKRTLSLVSQAFHEMTDEFLYEIVYINDPFFIRPLAKLLTQDNRDHPARGWWCRRLELDLKYHGYSWKWGTFTLWGLLPACPRLTDLRCSVSYFAGRNVIHNQIDINKRYPISETFLQLVVSSYQQTLRRLEFGGQLTISFEFAERLLSYLPALESCRILGLLPPNPHAGYDTGMPSEDTSFACTDAEEFVEYEAARREARWPETEGETPLTLSRLHTLVICQFTARISEWSMPSLRVIGVGLLHDQGSAWRLEELKKGLTNFAVELTKFTYYESSPVDIWAVVDTLPGLTHLEYHIPRRSVDLPLSKVHPHLQTITVCRNPQNDGGHESFLYELLQMVEGPGSMLPALKTLHVWGWPVPKKRMTLPFVNEFAATGISMDMKVTDGVPLMYLQHG